jgi:hypothetical protein
MVSLGLTFVPVATMTYVSDCYLPVNSDALELVNGLKVGFKRLRTGSPLTITEYCCIWLLIWSYTLDNRSWLYQHIRHPGRNICPRHGLDYSGHSLWQADEAHHG